MRIAPEGRPIIAGAWAVMGVLLALALWRGGWLVLPAAVWLPAALWVPWFFRDPPRDGPRGQHLIIAPADGKVVSVLDVDEPEYMQAAARRVSVFMNVFDVHVNRHPVSGTVCYRAYRPGAFLNATRNKASEANERVSVGFATPRGPVLVRQIAGLIARRIVTDVEPGALVRQGERLGIIRFGSRVDTFVPPDTAVRVQVGDHTRAGVTVIAEWPQ